MKNQNENHVAKVNEKEVQKQQQKQLENDWNVLNVIAPDYTEEVKTHVSPFGKVEKELDALFLHKDSLVADTFYKKGKEPYLQVESNPNVFYIRNHEQFNREVNELEGFPRMMLSHPNDEQYKEKYPSFYFKHIEKPKTFDDIDMIFQDLDQNILAPIFTKNKL